MHAPFARHLARFSRVPPPEPPAPFEDAILEHTPGEPMIALSAAEFEGRLQAARDAVREELQRAHAAQRAASELAHADALSEATADARAAIESEMGQAIADQIAFAAGALHETIAEELASAVRPILAEAMAEKIERALLDAIRRLLGETDETALTITGPARRLAPIELALGGRTGVTFVEEGEEIVVRANGSRVATRLRDAMALLGADKEP